MIIKKNDTAQQQFAWPIDDITNKKAVYALALTYGARISYPNRAGKKNQWALPKTFQLCFCLCTAAGNALGRFHKGRNL